MLSFRNSMVGFASSFIGALAIKVKPELYLLGNRLFMIMETTDDFSFENKAAMDLANAKVQEWENLMWKYQKALPMAKPGEKWILMDKIFSLQ